MTAHLRCLVYAFFFFFFFFFNDTATTEIYTLSLHDALPISNAAAGRTNDSTASAAIPTHCHRLRVASARVIAPGPPAPSWSHRVPSSPALLSPAPVPCGGSRGAPDRSPWIRAVPPRVGQGPACGGRPPPA